MPVRVPMGRTQKVPGHRPLPKLSGASQRLSPSGSKAVEPNWTPKSPSARVVSPPGSRRSPDSTGGPALPRATGKTLANDRLRRLEPTTSLSVVDAAHLPDAQASSTLNELSRIIRASKAGAGAKAQQTWEAFVGRLLDAGRKEVVYNSLNQAPLTRDEKLASRLVALALDGLEPRSSATRGGGAQQRFALDNALALLSQPATQKAGARLAQRVGQIEFLDDVAVPPFSAVAAKTSLPPQARTAAIYALRSTSQKLWPKAEFALQKALGDHDPAIRGSAAYAISSTYPNLGASKPATMGKLLLQRLEVEPDAQVKANLIGALAAVPIPKESAATHRQLLEAALEASSPTVRAAAVGALTGWRGDTDWLGPALLKSVKGNDNVATYVSTALLRLKPKNDAFAKALMKELPELHPHAQLDLIPLLGDQLHNPLPPGATHRAGTRRAIELALVEAMGTSNRSVRELATAEFTHRLANDESLLAELLAKETPKPGLALAIAHARPVSSELIKQQMAKLDEIAHATDIEAGFAALQRLAERGTISTSLRTLWQGPRLATIKEMDSGARYRAGAPEAHEVLRLFAEANR